MNAENENVKPARRWLSFLRSDNGDMLMESLATLIITALTIAAFSIAFVSVNKTQTSMQRNDIASQAARGVVEHAKSIDWGLLGFLPTDPGYRSSFSYNGTTYATATLNPADVDAEVDRVKPTETATIRGTTVSIRTDIRLDGNGKELIIRASYPHNGATKTKTVRAFIAPDARTASGAAKTGATLEPSDSHTWWGD